MRKIKSVVRILAKAVVAVMLLGTICSCQVGLGSQVDTESPTLKIEYPPSSAVIKGSFVFAGSCSDDQGVTAVAVTVINTETSASWSYSAAVDGTKWSVDNMNEADQTQASGYKFPDGKYEVSAVASDSAGHTSGASSRSFEIDNTAPIFVIKGPGSASISSPTAYGSVFKVTGTIADDHAPISYMDVTVYDENGTVLNNTDTTPYDYTNIETSGGTTVVIAKYSSTATEAVNTRYTDIYGTNSKAGTKKYYCTIKLTDSAKQYTDASESSNTTKGNSTTTIFLNDDVYSTYLSSTGLDLQIGDVKKIVNGTFTGTTTNGTTLTSDQQKNVRNAFKLYTDDTNTPGAKGITKAAFSLNADASPKYSVSGLKFTTTSATTDVDSGIYNIADNQSGAAYQITLSATAGLNDTYVEPKTLRVYMFGPFDAASSIDSTVLTNVFEGTASYAGYFDDATSYYDDSTGELTNKKGYILANENGAFVNTAYTGSSVESYTYPIKLPNAVAAGKYYVIAATGLDQDNISLEPMEGYWYGFKGASSTNPPTISFDTTEDKANAKNIANQSVFKTSAMTFTGVAKANGGTMIGSVSWSASVSDEANGNAALGSISGTATASDGAYDETEEAWTFKLSDGTNYSTYKAELDTGKLYLYDITVKATDSNNASSTQAEKYIHVDTTKPVVSLSAVSPIVTEGTTNYVNGKITISGSVVETNLASLKYNVYINGSSTSSKEVDLGSLYTFKTQIATTSFADNNSINIVITATDKAGNTGTYSTTEYNSNTAYVIKQSTDNPVISFTNADTAIASAAGIKTAVKNGAEKTNLFGVSTNNKLNATITDDDGVASVVMKCGTTGSGSYTTTLLNKSGMTSTTYPVTVTLPATEGAYDLQVVVQDTDGSSTTYNSTTDTLTFAVDSGAPTFSDVTLANGAYYDAGSNVALKVTGKATDASGTVTLKAEHDVTTAVSTFSSEAAVTSGTSWTDTVTTRPSAEGSHTITYTATDAYGQSATYTVTYIIDSTAPSFVNSGSYLLSIGGKTYSADNWFGDTSVSATGYFKENSSGIKTIYYWINPDGTNVILNNTSKSSGSITPNSATGDACKFSSTISGFTANSSSNMIYFAATDEVGNTSTATDGFAVKIDSVQPYITPTSSDTVLSNATTQLAITGTVGDATSGVDTSSIRVTKGSIAYTSGTSYTLTLTTTDLGSLNNGLNVINATVYDKAGNSYTGTIATVNIDKTAPTVTYTSPSASSTVNKTITISGTASDNSSLATGTAAGTLYVKKGSASTANNYSVDIAADGSWSYSLDTYTSTYYNSTTIGTITWYLVVKDTAGNSSAATNTRTVTVDQNADRPVINVTNISESGGVLKYGTKAQLTGTVSDDDFTDTQVAAKFIASSTQLTDAASLTSGGFTTTAAGVTTSTSSGTTTFKASTGDWIYEPASTADGTKTVYFYVVDNKSNIFYTGSADLSQTMIKFKGGTAFGNTSEVTYISDSESPTVKSGSAYYGTTGSLSTDKTLLTTGLYLGGTSRNAMKFYITAKDNNGIAGMTLLATDSANATICKYTTASTIVETTIDSGYSVSATNFSGTTTTNGSSTDATWTTPEINLSTFATGAVTVVVYAYDNSGLYNNATYTFSLDNTGPEVNITTPSSSEQVTGSVSMAGSAVDKDGAGTSSIQWAVPTVAQRTSNTTDALLMTNLKWTGTLSGGKTASAWQFDFDGSNNDNFTKYDSSNYYVSYSDGIYTLPVYFLAKDAFGNYSVTKYAIKHNPNADKPVTIIGFPTDSDYDSEVEYVTRSGSVAVTGSATDNTAVNKVFLQIATYDSATDTYSWTDTTTVANTYGFTVVKATDSASGILTTNTNCWTTETTAANWWGIPAVRSSSSWHINLNTDGKMDPASGSSATRIKIRACAVDENGLLGSWSNVYEVHIDNTVPAMEVTLNQYASGTTVSTVTSATATASSTFASDMYLKGTWWLKVLVSDTDGISSTSVYQGTTALTQGTGYARTEYSGSGESGYYLYIPIDTSSEGTIAYKVTSTDEAAHSVTSTYTMNIDNTAPTLGELRGNSELLTASTPIQNKNYIYSLSSSVTESGSGFERLAFFFLRDTVKTASTKRLYDCYLDNSSVYESAMDSVTDSGYTMWGKKYTGTMTTTTTFYSSGISSNTHIRKGGLIQIGGSYHLITSVSSDTVTFEGETPTTNTTAFFPYAQIVDNLTSEKTVWDTSSHKYTFSTEDDDGMPESVTKSGSTWAWDATVYSDSIPDGPITLWIVAFDKAGNITGTSVATSIENNPPRLAKVYLGTDLDGSGTYSDTEFEQYDMYYTKQGAQSSVALATKDWPTLTESGDSYQAATRNAFIVKDKLAVVPEFTGGNGEIKMVYQRPDQVTGTALTTPTAVTSANGTLISATSTVAASTATTGSVSSATLAKLSGSSMGMYVLNNAALTGATLTGDAVASETYDGTDKAMSFTFWDSTDELTCGTDSQKCVLLVTDFTYDLHDSNVPKSVIDPFYWTSATDNSLYDNSTANGHIDLESDWTASGSSSGSSGELDGNPKVSGKIVIRGSAYDDQRITGLYALIDSFTFKNASGAALATTTANGYSVVKLASYSAGTWTLTVTADTLASYGWKFTVTDGGISQSGHKATWELDWDTSMITNAAGTDKYIRIFSSDKGGSYSAATVNGTSSSGVATYNNPLYQVDVVPYVTSIARPSLSYNSTTISGGKMNRSSYGRYAVVEAEKINVTGFNFANASATTLPSVKVGMTAVTPSAWTTSGDYTTFTMTVPANSGELLVTANSVYTLNNKNYNSNTAASAYNLESGTSTTNNWYDDRYLSTWNLGNYFASTNGGVELQQPVMTADASGNLFASWVAQSNSNVMFSYGVSNNVTPIFRCYDQPSNYSGIAFDRKGSSGGATVMFIPEQQGSGGTFSNHAMSSSAMIGGAGAIQIGSDDIADNSGAGALYSGLTGITVAGNPVNTLDNTNNTAYWNLQSYDMTRRLGSFEKPKAARYGEYLHNVWYDNVTQSLKYSVVDDTAANVTKFDKNSGAVVGWVVLDGGYTGQDRVHDFTYRTASSYDVNNILNSQLAVHASTAKQLNGSNQERTWQNGAKYSADIFITAVTKQSNYSVNVTTNNSGIIPAKGDTIALLENTSGAYNISLRTLTGVSGSATGVMSWSSSEPVTHDIASVTIYGGNMNVVGGTATPNLYTGFTAASTQSTDAGSSSDIDVDSTGKPVIAYFDAANSQLRIAKATDVNPTLASQWTRIIPSSTNYTEMSCAGEVSMRIDSGNNIHIMYKNADSEMCYLYGAINTAGTGYTFSDPEVIDTTGALSYGELSIIESGTTYTPCVTYLNSAGTASGIKYAVRRTVTINGTATAIWDYQILPSLGTGHYPVAENRVCLEARKAGWTGTTITVLSNGGSTLTATPATVQAAVAFKTKQYETAYLKIEK